MIDSFVVDNSVVMSWCFEDESNTYTDQILDKLAKSSAIVPSIFPLEVANVLLVAERRKRIGEANSARFIELINELPIMVVPEPSGRIMSEIIALAREHQLSSYDASYLDLAMRKGIPIATLDKNLLAAAKRIRVKIL